MKANLSLDYSENVNQEEMNHFHLVELLRSRSNLQTSDRCQGLGGIESLTAPAHPLGAPHPAPPPPCPALGGGGGTGPGSQALPEWPGGAPIAPGPQGAASPCWQPGDRPYNVTHS